MIIIDTNCLAAVFKGSSARHEQFKPVLDWIIDGDGKMVYGGTKYIGELKKCSEILNIINHLKDRSKVIVASQQDVDEEQKRIETIITDSDFDDPHLPAIAIVARCHLICSLDKRSIKYVKDPRLYPRHIKAPKYYTGLRNKHLLCSKYVDNSYK